ncbi:hypothetical protein O9929_13410 [Vibrio lentus]|nr:hypothetical protein [Vibrio lentus]
MQNIDAAFFTTEPEFRYFSGFKSQFLRKANSTLVLVVPAVGKPIAVVQNRCGWF